MICKPIVVPSSFNVQQMENLLQTDVIYDPNNQ